MLRFVLTLVLVVAARVTLGAESGSERSPKYPIRACVNLAPDPKFAERNVSGELQLSQASEQGPVSIVGWIGNLPASRKFGFHVHQSGDIGKGCAGAGSHFNPRNRTHGSPTDDNRHAGDLGNVVSNATGVALIELHDYQISLCADCTKGILGRAFVVHSAEDDLGRGGNSASLQTGNAGDRWACGKVEIHV